MTVLSHEDRKKLVEKLNRERPAIQDEIPEEFQAFRDMTDCAECFIESSEGKSRFFIIQKKGRTRRAPLYVNLHGGGFVVPHMLRDIGFTTQMACLADCVVIDIDYKVSPGYTFPAALNETYDIINWAVENSETLNIDPNMIAVGGHSAGGNLTAAVAIKANLTNAFKIRLQIMDYPALDMKTDAADKKDSGEGVPVKRSRAFNMLYVPKEELDNPLASPVLAPPEWLAGLPEALIMTAGLDNLRHEAHDYANMLITAGVKVTVKCYLTSRHGFVINCLDDYRQARLDYAQALRHAFESSPIGEQVI